MIFFKGPKCVKLGLKFKISANWWRLKWARLEQKWKFPWNMVTKKMMSKIWIVSLQNGKYFPPKAKYPGKTITFSHACKEIMYLPEPLLPLIHYEHFLFLVKEILHHKIWIFFCKNGWLIIVKFKGKSKDII